MAIIIATHMARKRITSRMTVVEAPCLASVSIGIPGIPGIIMPPCACPEAAIGEVWCGTGMDIAIPSIPACIRV